MFTAGRASLFVHSVSFEGFGGLRVTFGLGRLQESVQGKNGPRSDTLLFFVESRLRGEVLHLVEGFGKILSLQRGNNLIGQIFILRFGIAESLLQSGRDLLDRQRGRRTRAASITACGQKKSKEQWKREPD